jgi:Transposase
VKEELVYLGVDIAKSYLDGAIGAEKRRFSNDEQGHRQLIKWVKQLSAAVQVICESSGGYERALVQVLVRAGVKISLVQANRVRQFARAAGILAKTDCIDAQVLCEFGKVMRPPTVTAATLEQEHLRELESQRRHLTRLLLPANTLDNRRNCRHNHMLGLEHFYCWQPDTAFSSRTVRGAPAGDEPSTFDRLLHV